MLREYSVEHNGRLRKYYHITPKGVDRLKEFENEWNEMQAVYGFITREGTFDDKK